MADGDREHRTTVAVEPTGSKASRAGLIAATRALAELCRLWVDCDDPRTRLARVATVSRAAVPGATGLSITLGHPKAPDVLATESAYAQAVDGAQYRAEEGPCVDAFTTRRIQLADDLASDARWPTLAASAADLGVGSAIGVPLVWGPDVLGVLNVYADVPEAFDEAAIEEVDLLAAAVAAALQGAQERAVLRALNRQLQEALDSRAQIEQAKGMVMAMHRCGADEAFERLVSMSRNTNTKLRDVAAQLVAERIGLPPGVDDHGKHG